MRILFTLFLLATSSLQATVGLYSDYIQSKENDPSLNAPVVRTIYFDTRATYEIEKGDCWDIEANVFVFQQREDKIYPPQATNYDVLMEGAALKSRYRFCKNWRWDLFVRGFGADGHGTEAYRFQDTYNIEPGTALTYRADHYFVSFAGYFDSMIIKNFDSHRSQLERMQDLELFYGYGLKDHCLYPELLARVAHVFYQDSLDNFRDDQSLFFKIGKQAILDYLVEHSGFDKLSRNYTSYKSRWRNTVGVALERKICQNTIFFLRYEHRWESTKDLFMPIGDAVFIAPHQFLIANKVATSLIYQVTKKTEASIGAHYFRDNLPYREWKVWANLAHNF